HLRRDAVVRAEPLARVVREEPVEDRADRHPLARGIDRHPVTHPLESVPEQTERLVPVARVGGLPALRAVHVVRKPPRREPIAAVAAAAPKQTPLALRASFHVSWTLARARIASAPSTPRARNRRVHPWALSGNRAGARRIAICQVISPRG